jgi:hypothetical protein
MAALLRLPHKRVIERAAVEQVGVGAFGLQAGEHSHVFGRARGIGWRAS